MKKTEVSRVAKQVLVEKGFRFRLGQEVWRNLWQAKLNSHFLNWLDKKLLSLIGFIREIDRKI